MSVIPKEIDPKVKERCVRQMLERASEYPNPTVAAEVVAKCNGLGGDRAALVSAGPGRQWAAPGCDQ